MPDKDKKKKIKLININRMQVAGAILPGLITAIVLGLMFWDFIDVFRVSIIFLAALMVTVIVFNILGRKHDWCAVLEFSSLDDSDDTEDAEEEAEAEEVEEDVDQEDEQEDEEEEIEEEPVEQEPHWYEMPYPDPDEEFGSDSEPEPEPEAPLETGQEPETETDDDTVGSPLTDSGTIDIPAKEEDEKPTAD